MVECIMNLQHQVSGLQPGLWIQAYLTATCIVTQKQDNMIFTHTNHSPSTIVHHNMYIINDQFRSLINVTLLFRYYCVIRWPCVALIVYIYTLIIIGITLICRYRCVPRCRCVA